MVVGRRLFAFPITKATFQGRAVKLREGIDIYCSLKKWSNGVFLMVERIKCHLSKDKSKTFRGFPIKKKQTWRDFQCPRRKWWPQNSLGSENARDFLSWWSCIPSGKSLSSHWTLAKSWSLSHSAILDHEAFFCWLCFFLLNMQSSKV